MKKNDYSDFGIGEVQERTGISQKKIRYWEEKGYIPAPERIVCGKRAYRRYSENHLKLLRLIKRYLMQGYTLEGASRLARHHLEKGGGNNGDE